VSTNLTPATNLPPAIATTSGNTATSTSAPTIIQSNAVSTPTAKPSYGVTLGSIKGLKSNAKEKIEAASKNKQIVPITHDNLMAAWDAIILELTSDKVFFRSAIGQGSIDFEGFMININVFGVAYDFLKNLRLKLLDYFKIHYNNDEINVMIHEKAPSADKMMEQVKSTREIFEKMAEQNPLLKKLKDSLGMDFES
jgi:hypothetical protein